MKVDKQLLANVCALYREVNYAIKHGTRTLEPIPSNLGLKQGCPLSPLLFNLYINDLSSYLNKTREESLVLKGTLVNHFMYADDLVILSETRQGLQNQLDSLKKFADDKDLSVNTKKSMIMIFNKTGKLMTERLTYGLDELKVVHSFTYLGVDITSSGSFSLGIKELNNKARKAIFSLYRTIMQFEVPYTEAIKLFHTYIEPILMYNIENLSTLTDKEIEKCKEDYNHIFQLSSKATITTTQLKFLKFALGLHKQGSNMATFGETAELPLFLKGLVRTLCYWKRISSMEEETLVKKAYTENIEMNTNWCQTIQVLNASLGLNAMAIEDKDFKKVTKDTMGNKFITVWDKTIRRKEGKLNFYAKVKKKFQVEPYLTSPLCFKDRRLISRLVCSDHVLEIERGRHDKDTLREDRICQVCEQHVVEDEDHFLLECKAYEELRKTNLTPEDLEKIKSGNLHEIDPHTLAKYLKQAFKIRDSKRNFHLAKINLDTTGITLRKGSQPSLPKDQYLLHVSSTSICGMKMTISKGKGPPKKKARVDNTPIVKTLNKDGFKFLICKQGSL